MFLHNIFYTTCSLNFLTRNVAQYEWHIFTGGDKQKKTIIRNTTRVNVSLKIAEYPNSIQTISVHQSEYISLTMECIIFRVKISTFRRVRKTTRTRMTQLSLSLSSKIPLKKKILKVYFSYKWIIQPFSRSLLRIFFPRRIRRSFYRVKLPKRTATSPVPRDPKSATGYVINGAQSTSFNKKTHEGGPR